MTQNVEVTEQAPGAVTSNAEISQTISMEEIQNLPILDRDPMALIQTQPGVVSNGNSATVINGLRTSYSDVTLDGINIQDNYIRDNALDYTPNRLLLSQVRQVTLVTSNGNAALSGGATEEAFSTPSGTNRYHGDAFWYNRNNAFSANDWFNNQAGVGLPFLNQNQMGGTMGGPIKKDKLFFYGSYEAVRTHAQSPAETAILTAPARQGIFSYRDSAGVVHQMNILALRGISIDPVMQAQLNQVPGPQYINNTLVGDGLNFSGYRFNQRDNETRDNVTGRIDYNLSTAQAVSGTFSWNRDNSDRPDLENDYSAIPKVYQSDTCEFSGALLALDAHCPVDQRSARRLQSHLWLLPDVATVRLGPDHRHVVFRPGERIHAAGPHHQYLFHRRRCLLPARQPLHPVRLPRPAGARALLRRYRSGAHLWSRHGNRAAEGHARKPATCPASAPPTWRTPIRCWRRWAVTSITTARPSTSPAALRASFPARLTCGTFP